MRKYVFLFVFGFILVINGFSQNVLLLSADLNFFKPQLYGAGVGFNFKIFNEFIQNDTFVNFGIIRAKSAPDGRYAQRFIFTISDKIYLYYDWQWIGARAGVFAGLGIYNIEVSPALSDAYIYAGGFAGICILPKSLVSITIDACPGYSQAFRLNGGLKENDKGFFLSVSLGIRINFDKL